MSIVPPGTPPQGVDVDLLGAGPGGLEGDRLGGGAIRDRTIDVTCQPDDRAGREREHQHDSGDHRRPTVATAAAHGADSVARKRSIVAVAVTENRRLVDCGSGGATISMPRADTEHDTVTATRPPDPNRVTSTWAEGEAHVSGSVSIAPTTCWAAVIGGRGRAFLSGSLRGRLGGGAYLRPRVDLARQEHDEQCQTDRDRRDEDEAERFRCTSIVSRRRYAPHGVQPSSGTAATTETSVEVPRMIPGAAPDTVTVTS